LIAVGLNLIYGTMRLLNVAHGDIVMIGAYAAFWLFTLAGLNPFIAIVLVPLAVAATGALFYHGLFRRILRAGRPDDRIEANSLLVFFGISIALENLASIAFTGNTRAYQFLDQLVHIGDASIVANRLVALIVAGVACAGVLVFFRFSTLGLAVRAIIQNRDASQIVGVDVERIRLLTFCLGFGLAGLCGVLVSLYSQIWPFMGFSYTVSGFVIIILGGLGNVLGSVVGGLLLGVLETLGVAAIGANYRSILIYGVFIAILLWRPQGLFGARSTMR
jgi:branched-chain amino acid transport system permease protein